MEADLAAGRHAELVGELQQLVAEHPTRERLAGQLMLALYRCGRQAEALEVYRERARARSSRRSASSPGRSCAALHEAILRQDPSLDLSQPPGAAARARHRRRRPLAGRGAELAGCARAGSGPRGGTRRAS